MRLTRFLLAVAVVLVAAVAAADASNGLTSSETNKEISRRELSDDPAAVEERGRRGGGGRIRRTGTHTSIGLMYPNATPHFKKAMRNFVKWFKRVFGIKDKKKTTTESESTRRLRLLLNGERA